MNLEIESKRYNLGVLDELKESYTNTDGMKNTLDYNIDGCSCMGCGCFKSAWTIVLSPAGVAVGMGAFATAAAL